MVQKSNWVVNELLKSTCTQNYPFMIKLQSGQYSELALDRPHD